MKFPKVKQKTVVVTGCSSGIGLATAKMLQAAGWSVIPTARKDADLKMLEGLGFQPVKCDVADAGAVIEAARIIQGRLPDGLGGLVNNAGIAQLGAVEDLTREALRRQFEVNLFGAQDLTNRLLPILKDQGWGRIVNVSSVYGRIVAPMVGAYCASKYAMEALTDAMRMELRACGIGVSLIEPGPIVSEFRKNAAVHSLENLDTSRGRYGKKYRRKFARAKHKPAPRFSLPPEAVAGKIQHALESPRPRTRYYVTAPAHAAAILRRMVPTTWLDALLAKSART